MVVRRISARDAQTHFVEVVGAVNSSNEPVIVESDGKPLAVMISPQQYDVMEEALKRAWTTIDRIRDRNADEDPEQMLADITTVVEEVRQERYGRDKNPHPSHS